MVMKNFREIFGSLFDGDSSRRPQPSTLDPAYKDGDVIGGKYQVYSLLGRGGFGEVYLVYSKNDQSAYALKTFRQEFLADDKIRGAFKREALLWVKLDLHPFILAALSVEEFSGRLFVSMDYVAPDHRGRVSLVDHLACSHGPLDTDQTLRWGIQFCHGMTHAHGCGIECHRDIKPANILIRQDGTLLITDFGLATAAQAASRATLGPRESLGGGSRFSLALFETAGRSVCGTPGYMAPEAFRGERADVRSDIYSFGLVLWQMATGSQAPPFVLGVPPPESPLDVERFAADIYAQQMEGRVPAVADPFEGVLQRCLAPSASQRYGSFTELRSELETILNRRTGGRVEAPAQYVWSIPYWVNKGSSLWSLGRYDEAATCFKKALEILSVDKCPERAAAEPPEVAAGVTLAHQGLGLTLHAKGDIDGAIAEFRTAIRLQPNAAAAHSNLGAALKAKGNLDDAIAEWRVALSLAPELAAAHANLGGALQEKGDVLAAIAEYRTAIRLQPDMALAHNLLGDALQTRGDIEEAITHYRTAIGIQPDLALAHTNLGVALQAKGDIVGAIAEYRTAIRLRPDLAGAHTKLGDALKEQGKLDEAIAEYRTAIRLQPGNGDAHCNLGIALATKGDLDGAITEYHVAMHLAPRSAAAHSNLGSALHDKGALDAAIAEYRTAISLQPDLAQAHYNLGIALRAKSDLAGAINEYRTAVRLNPDWALAHHNLGNALRDQYDIDGAIAEYRTAIRIQPNLTAARTNLEMLVRIKRTAFGRTSR
jgi:eukaryotic-like serine/threonine-protein kinase